MILFAIYIQIFDANYFNYLFVIIIFSIPGLTIFTMGIMQIFYVFERKTSGIDFASGVVSLFFLFPIVFILNAVILFFDLNPKIPQKMQQ